MEQSHINGDLSLLPQDAGSANSVDHTTCNLSHITRKLVFGVCDQLRLKQACSADETSQGLEILAIASRGYYTIQAAKAQIRLRGYAG